MGRGRPRWGSCPRCGKVAPLRNFALYYDTVFPNGLTIGGRVAHYIQKYGSQLGLSQGTRKAATRFAAEFSLHSKGMNPRSMAAGVLYIAGILGGERRTQSEVAKVVGCIETTVLLNYKKIAKALKIEMPWLEGGQQKSTPRIL